VKITALIIILVPVILLVASYLVYPLVLLGLSRVRRSRTTAPEPAEWPELTICVPVYNEQRAIAATLDNLLALDYPPERRHLLVISDASTDATDTIVASYAERGVWLVRLPQRSGKTAAENEAGRHLRGSIVVNLDATILVQANALKALVRAFQDPEVGVASGRDLSVGDAQKRNQAESTYVDYEMWVRGLETRCGTIVGASGCFYAIRRELFDAIFPEALSRDFASPLLAREMGYRSVAVEEAVCAVPRTRSLRNEYRRKVRTMTRGLETLWYKRQLMNPFRYGRFAAFLIAHKLLRWAVCLTLPLAGIGLALLALSVPWARVTLAALVGLLVLGALGYSWPERKPIPRLLTVAGFVVSSQAAGMVAWIRALRRELDPVWEPTRRA